MVARRVSLFRIEPGSGLGARWFTSPPQCHPGLIHFGLLTRRPRLPRKGLAQPACKIIDKVDSRAMFVEWWNARSESTSRPAGAVPSGEASERHRKMPRLVRLPG